MASNRLLASNAGALLATGGVIWVTNVIAFGLWYWDLDRGGAAAGAALVISRAVNILR